MDADPTAPAPPPALAPPTGPAPSWPAPARPVFARFALPLFADTPIAAAEPVPIPQPGPTAPDLALIAPYVDPAYYLASFPADETARRNPVAHFHQFGWRLGRNPNAWFDTQHYLAAFDDVRSAGIDPLLHYLRSGRAEGRAPRRIGGYRRALIDGATPPARRIPGNDAPPGAVALDAGTLCDHLHAVCRGRRGLVVALSQDRYLHRTGDVRIFIADEEAQFTSDRFAYLHIAPVRTLPTLADEPVAQDGSDAMPLQLLLNGQMLGIALCCDVIAALAALPSTSGPMRLFIVHSLLGHRTTVAAGIAAALRPHHRFFWVHDYATLCVGRELLRNDVAYCHAPPQISMACRVCVYGEGRAAQHDRIRALFTAVDFEVVAPSRAALDIWRKSAEGLPARALRVHPYAMLRPQAEGAAPGGPIRVAFVGVQAANNGWPLFLELLQRAGARTDFSFYHFADAAALRPMRHLASIPTQIGPHDRHEMTRVLAAADIDLVTMLSPWPETFNLIAREALAAGADIVTLSDSGGVAEVVQAMGRGVVLATSDDVLRFFLDGHAAAYVQQQRTVPRPRATVIPTGATASIDLTRVHATAPTDLATDDPDLVLLTDDLELPPLIDGPRHHFSLPAGASQVRLISRTTTPARLDPACGDHRRLGIAIRVMTLDGEIVPHGDPRLLRGWHGADATDPVQWTNGDALLQTDGARSLIIELAPLARYQRSPLGCVS